MGIDRETSCAVLSVEHTVEIRLGYVFIHLKVFFNVFQKFCEIWMGQVECALGRSLHPMFQKMRQIEPIRICYCLKGE